MRSSYASPPSIAVAGCVLILTVTLLRSAWVAEDAFITLRTVDNLIQGYGLTWNPSERVQAYTHPLWMFALAASYAMAQEPFYSTMALSFALTVPTVLLFALGLASTPNAAVLGLLVLTFSRAFVDYAVSGMENPLSHLLAVLFLWTYFSRGTSRRALVMLAGIAALALLNRLDAIALYLPPLAYRSWQLGVRKSLLPVAIGFTPLLVWECFATIYYGFPVPNTAFAKLTTGIPEADLVRQGFLYLLDSLQRDPLTMTAVVAGVATPVALKSKAALMVSLGVLLQLLYIVSIGGDFMSGRLLSLPLICATVLLCRGEFRRQRHWAAALVVAVALGLSSPFPTVFNGSSFGAGGDDPVGEHGIADERRFYFQYSGLLNEGARPKEHPWARRGEQAKLGNVHVITYFTVGFFGFFAGPGVHVLDPFGVADPLLSKIASSDPNWRIGHFRRGVPDGYVESLAQDRNLIEDPDLAEYYDHLRLVTRGDSLLDWRRLAAIWHLNFGVRYPLPPPDQDQ